MVHFVSKSFSDWFKWLCNVLLDYNSLNSSVTIGELICVSVFRSIGLLIQVALPCILFTNGITTLKLRGGTNAEMAPQIDYTTEVC